MKFDAKIHSIDVEARSSAVEGLIKKYLHQKNASFNADLTKSADHVSSESEFRMSVFANTLR
jgi:hypothetical protein